MSTDNLTPVKLVFCGPSDVAKEIAIAKEVVEKWNQYNAEARGLWIKLQHWETDTYPDLSDRAQSVINAQLIDKSQIVVAIFWWRFGTPTGVVDSGTQEEILRAAGLGRKVMVYFSDLEPIPPDADRRQLEQLSQFRQILGSRGFCKSFKSRDQFRKLFEAHLTLVLNAFEPRPIRPKPARKTRPNISQQAKTEKGDIYQHVGNKNIFYKRPPVEKIIRERRPGSVTAEEEHQIGEWIEDLAEGEVNRTRSDAYRMWGGRFKKAFLLGHRGDLPSAKMPAAQGWYRQQKAIQTRELKRKAPDSFRTKRIGSIKGDMRRMGKTNDLYYPELSARLRIRKPFASLKDLTNRNLDRVYNLVRSDARNWT